MRNLYLIFMFFHLSSFAQTYFNERYNLGPQNALNIAHNILFNQNDRVVVGDFVTTDQLFHYKVSLMTISEQGESENIKIISDSLWGYALNWFSGGFKRYSSSSYYAVGLKNRFTDFTISRGNIFKIGNNLDSVWNHSFGDAYPYDSNYFFRHMDITKDSSLIIIGYIIKNGGPSDVLLLKSDSSGNELWRKYYESGQNNMGINVLSLPDGGYALSCHKWVFQSTVSHNYLIRTDSLGNELWRRYIGGDLDDGPLFLAWSDVDSTIVGAYHTADSAITNADSYNRLALIKLDMDNNLIYENKYMPEKNYDQWNFSVNGLNLDNEGNIIVVGSTNEPVYHSEGYLFKISNDGDSLWYRQYRKGLDNQTDHYLTGVTSTPDDGYAAVGYFVPAFSDTGNQDVWVIKVDSMGCIAQNDCWVGNKEIMALQSKESLKIYPNPASNRIKILIPQKNGNEEYVLTIWDLFGRKLEEVIVTSGQTEVELDISEYSTGLFNVIATKDGKNAGNGKFIKR